MGRIATRIVVAAVAFLALVAAFDGFRGHESAQPVRTPPPAAAPAGAGLDRAARTLGAANLSGLLFYSGSDCRLHAVALPHLDGVRAPPIASCNFAVSPRTGQGLQARGTAAFCDRGDVAVADTSGHVRSAVAGCEPAWRPDGSLTYVQGGAVLEFPPYGRPRMLLTPKALGRALGRTGPAAVREVAWLGADRLAAIVATGRADVLAMLDRGHLVAWTAFAGGPLFGLQASPRSDRIAVRVGPRLAVLDRRLRGVRLPVAAHGARSVAWSPDERWLAAALDRRIVFVRSDARYPAGLVVPIDALELAWR